MALACHWQALVGILFLLDFGARPGGATDQSIGASVCGIFRTRTARQLPNNLFEAAFQKGWRFGLPDAQQLRADPVTFLAALQFSHAAKAPALNARELFLGELLTLWLRADKLTEDWPQTDTMPRPKLKVVT